MAGKIELKNSKGQFMFNLKASNGKIILTSERYTTKSGAMNGIESVKKNSKLDGQYERLESKKGEPYFVLKAKNNEPIGRSEMYSSKSAIENGIASVKENAPSAEIVDLTE
ncbi:MAG TPA: hypothetical protein DCK95_01070 [Anaerolineaceae bacterium]|uniref:DUF1508 domain-containing protein n=1 Tax=Anaerolinea thermophila TaxID=167964 RepID=A0A101FYI0_9CHLR|nr:MAG: Uncharacterized protein XD73_0293 [Anaerolinea thermophila]HAF60900.1 hypothetical protein [Anaerolineaceae bacterium]